VSARVGVAIIIVIGIVIVEDDSMLAIKMSENCNSFQAVLTVPFS
jgi:hypothetical protein